MEKMLVTQGLNELKTLDSRICRAITSTNFVAAAKTCEKKVTPNKTKEEFNADAISGYQSIVDLIARREAIKAAIVNSNAVTQVEICGEKMTVAKAIELKNSIDYRSMLLNEMKRQRDSEVVTVNKQNATMETKLDQLIVTSFGKESKTTVKTEDYDTIAVPYRKANEYSLVDPLEIDKKIEAEERYVEEFQATVDQVLQISNCITCIEL